MGEINAEISELGDFPMSEIPESGFPMSEIPESVFQMLEIPESVFHKVGISGIGYRFRKFMLLVLKERYNRFKRPLK